MALVLRSGKGSSTPTSRKKTKRVSRENSKSLANRARSKSTSPTSLYMDATRSRHGDGMLHSDSGCGLDDTSVSGESVTQNITDDQNGVTIENTLVNINLTTWASVAS